MEPKTRKYRVAEGREVILPAALTEGPHNTRLFAGDVVELDCARLRTHQRHIANRVKWGDLVEVDASTPIPAPAQPPTKES